MAIRFSEADARPMGRNTSGVKGITLSKGDTLVGMVVADPDATLLTACQNGYGKRTPFGPNAAAGDWRLGTEDWRTKTSDVSPQPQPPAAEDDEAEGDRRPPASATARSAAAARASATSRPPTATAR